MIVFDDSSLVAGGIRMPGEAGGDAGIGHISHEVVRNKGVLRVSGEDGDGAEPYSPAAAQSAVAHLIVGGYLFGPVPIFLKMFDGSGAMPYVDTVASYIEELTVDDFVVSNAKSKVSQVVC